MLVAEGVGQLFQWIAAVNHRPPGELLQCAHHVLLVLTAAHDQTLERLLLGHHLGARNAARKAGEHANQGNVATYGAGKYTDHGWRTVPNGRARYTDAMYRHLLAEASGHVQDDESGLQHAAHAAWNALARLELMLSAQPATHQEPQP